ncbi:MAG TPA: cytochrome c biogenesis protein CcdA [Actinomycetota bacterium]|nr:cytochrome c biogenesis protein CcdA [Actinomycetota bacterium]
MEVGEALRAWWAPALAFAAGVVSCASPCVLPLLPGYLSFISGSREEPGSRGRAVLRSLLFVLGFAVVFTSLGAFSRALVPVVRSPVGQAVAGTLVAVVGVLMVLFALRLGSPRLFAERRPFLSRVRPGPVGALPLGMAFAVGWTPCIGPVLAGILGLALAQGGGAWGAVLLFAYSLGLGLPFVLVGLGVDRLAGALGFVRRNYHWFAGIGGTLLVVIGVLVATNLWTVLLSRLGLLRLVQGFSPPI